MQRTNFEYDANSVVPSFSANVNGRLAVAKSYATTVTGGTTAITTFYEMYSYDSAGRVLKKRLRVSNNALGDVDKDIEYSFTGAKLDSVKYPDINVPFTYYYDNMLRPNRMTGKDPSDYQNGTNVVDYVNSVNYSVSSRMTSMWALNIGSSTYTYNVRNELTRQQTGSLADIEYEYSPAADNGQILSRTNNISAEKVSYQYDALKRLVSASSPNWGSTYKHDGWGNLTDKTPTSGSAPLLSVTVNGLTNRINSGGFTYDANGNMTSSGAFDVENRLTTAGSESYGYLTNNQRVYKRDASGAEWIYFHDASGKRIMTFQMANAGGTLVVSGGSKNVYFAGRSIILSDTAVVTDRVGSVVSRAGAAVDYFPYGEEKTVTANPSEKFGTYLRDATGLDYANQRYFASGTGRFLSSDPYEASGGPSDPGSLNRSSYVMGDPINFVDPIGLYRSTLDGIDVTDYGQFSSNSCYELKNMSKIWFSELNNCPIGGDGSDSEHYKPPSRQVKPDDCHVQILNTGVAGNSLLPHFVMQITINGITQNLEAGPVAKTSSSNPLGLPVLFGGGWVNPHPGLSTPAEIAAGSPVYVYTGPTPCFVAATIFTADLAYQSNTTTYWLASQNSSSYIYFLFTSAGLTVTPLNPNLFFAPGFEWPSGQP